MVVKPKSGLAKLKYISIAGIPLNVENRWWKMPLTAVERFVLMYIYYEYGGKIYFQAPGDKSPEEFVARFITEDFLPEKHPNFQRVVKGFAEALKGLSEKGMIEMRGYEIILTPQGQGEAMAMPMNEYLQLKKKFTRV